MQITINTSDDLAKKSQDLINTVKKIRSVFAYKNAPYLHKKTNEWIYDVEFHAGYQGELNKDAIKILMSNSSFKGIQPGENTYSLTFIFSN